MVLHLYFLTFYGGWRGPKCLTLGCLFHWGSNTGFFALLGTPLAFAFAAVFFLEPVYPRDPPRCTFSLFRIRPAPPSLTCLFVCCFEDPRSKSTPWVSTPNPTLWEKASVGLSHWASRVCLLKQLALINKDSLPPHAIHSPISFVPNINTSLYIHSLSLLQCKPLVGEGDTVCYSWHQGHSNELTGVGNQSILVKWMNEKTPTCFLPRWCQPREVTLAVSGPSWFGPCSLRLKLNIAKVNWTMLLIKSTNLRLTHPPRAPLRNFWDDWKCHWIGRMGHYFLYHTIFM